MWPVLISLVAAPGCPPDMVLATPSVCIDRLPWPNYADHPPMFGLSALPESYLKLDGATWDLEALCASRGKRICRWSEWRAACEGTPRDLCPSQQKAYVAPRWNAVGRRDPFELLRLDQHEAPSAFQACVGHTGAAMMGTAQEWVRYLDGYAFSRGFWSRKGGCGAITTGHDPKWHDYATTGRCCHDL